MATLYGSIALLASFLDHTADLTREKLKDWFWLDYLKLAVFPVLQALIAIRAVFDQTVSKHIEKLGRTPIEGNQ